MKRILSILVAVLFLLSLCAANALAALIDGASLQVGGTLTTKLGSYEVQDGAFGEFSIVAGPPYRYTK